MTPSIPAAEALRLDGLVASTPDGIASRVLAKTDSGSLTLFAFDAGQELTEHASPYEAFAQVLEGRLRLTVGGVPVEAVEGTLVRLPASVPHALEALERTRMLLVMLKPR